MSVGHAGDAKADTSARAARVAPGQMARAPHAEQFGYTPEKPAPQPTHEVRDAAGASGSGQTSGPQSAADAGAAISGSEPGAQA